MSGAAHPSIGIGFRVGKLTVQAPTEQRKNGYTVWECRCDCGGSIRLDTRALRRGAIRECGAAGAIAAIPVWRSAHSSPRAIRKAAAARAILR